MLWQIFNECSCVCTTCTPHICHKHHKRCLWRTIRSCRERLALYARIVCYCGKQVTVGCKLYILVRIHIDTSYSLFVWRKIQSKILLEEKMTNMRYLIPHGYIRGSIRQCLLNTERFCCFVHVFHNCLCLAVGIMVVALFCASVLFCPCLSF